MGEDSAPPPIHLKKQKAGRVKNAMLFLNKLIDAASSFLIQKQQYTERIPLSGTVPAGQTLPFKANVSNLGHFLCLSITGVYDTLVAVTVGGVTKTVDDGVCHLRMQMEDGGTGQRLLFADFAPLDCFLSPGRRRSSTATNNLLDVATFALRADPAPQIFFPTEQNYLFSANSDIICRIKNDSNVDLTFDFLFYGVRRKSVATTTGAKK